MTEHYRPFLLCISIILGINQFQSFFEEFVSQKTLVYSPGCIGFHWLWNGTYQSAPLRNRRKCIWKSGERFQYIQWKFLASNVFSIRNGGQWYWFLLWYPHNVNNNSHVNWAMATHVSSIPSHNASYVYRHCGVIAFTYSVCSVPCTQ